jgi:hypothetical protein
VKLIACLAFYDEPIPFLERHVRSVARVADELVAFDGAWHGHPDGKPHSPVEQALTIKTTALAAGLPCIYYSPQRTWLSQVEKRDALMRYASGRCAKNDWLLVIDGDEHVHGCDNASLRWLLEHTDYDVATVNTTRTHGQRLIEGSTPMRRLYRAPVTVERAHNGYRRDGQWLNGDSAYVRLARAADATPHLHLHHEHMNRGDERNGARLAYRMERRREQSETWV